MKIFNNISGIEKIQCTNLIKTVFLGIMVSGFGVKMAIANKMRENAKPVTFQIVNAMGEEYEIIAELESIKSNVYCFQFDTNGEEDLNVACIDKKSKELYLGNEAIKLIQVDHD